MPLFGPPNVEEMKTKGNVKGLIKALGYNKDHVIRRDAADALGQIGDSFAVSPLIAALRDDDLEVRCAVANALGAIGDGRAVEPLISFLNNQDLNMRCCALKALGRIGDARAVEPLIKSLKEWKHEELVVFAEALGQFYLREEAIKALGQIGNDRAAEALVAALKDEKGSTRRTAADELSNIGWKPEQDEIKAYYFIARKKWDQCVEIGESAVIPLIGALEDADKDTRLAVAEILGKIGDTRAVEPLIASLNDKYSNVRIAAAKSLGQIGDAQAVEPLIATLQSNVSDLRMASVIALGEIGDARAVKALIDAFEDEVGFVGFSAARSLGQIGSPAVEPLITVLNSDNYNTRKRAVEALGLVGDAGAVEPLIVVLQNKDEDYLVQDDAVMALGRIGSAAVKPLVACLENKEWVVRRRSAEALGLIGDTQAVVPLINVLSDGDQYVRRASVVALGQIGDTRAVEPLLEALKDPTDDVCKAAAVALGQIKDDSTLDALIAKLPTVDENVVLALDEIGWKPGRDEASVWYWLVKGDVEKCVAIGAGAVDILITALNVSDEKTNIIAAQALEELGDLRAVEPLIIALDGPAAESAARALASLYKSRKLRKKDKLAILKHSDRIKTWGQQQHTDIKGCWGTEHQDSGPRGFHADFPY